MILLRELRLYGISLLQYWVTSKTRWVSPKPRTRYDTAGFCLKNPEFNLNYQTGGKRDVEKNNPVSDDEVGLYTSKQMKQAR